MIIIITGATHTGKTNLAQIMLEKYEYPYLPIDHLKMGLIRSGYTDLTPYDDDKLTTYLWPVVKEMIKTAIENKQNMIIEGCYIPFDWRNSFDATYLKHIKYICLAFSDEYIDKNYNDIKKYSNVIENRIADDIKIDKLKKDNKYYIEGCTKYNENIIIINDNYKNEIKSLLDDKLKR